MSLTFEEKYNAIGKKESFYEGQFITAVKTTNIFCRPSCSAKKPLAKNVVFYKNSLEAMQNGFRPCKMCKPMQKEGATPKYINDLIKDIHKKPYQKIQDQNLRELGLEPNRVRRWFKKNHNMTFQAYQRLIRINLGYQEIKKGEKVINAAFDSGFDSLSGFSEGYKQIFGDSPKKGLGKPVIYIHRFTTRLGPMFVCATTSGVCLLEFTDRRMLESEFKDIRRRFKAPIIPGENIHIKNAVREVLLYFSGELKEFKTCLDAPGTDFQKQAWKALQKIPYGAQLSYKQQSLALNNPKAVRAVANANGMNRIAFMIPCHRVVGSDGSLTGYGGGLHRKKWLLEHEAEHS